MTLAERLAPFAGRPTLAAVALMNAITGLAGAVVLAPLSFGSDVDFLRRGAEGFLTHTAVRDFVFTPLAAVAAVPLTWVSPTVGAVMWSLVEVVLLLVCVALETRGRATIDRVLVGIAVLGFLPVVNELLLGQVTVVIAAGILPVVARDGRGRGIPLGIVLALVPKPLLIPVLVWMALRRRRALAEAVVVALALTLAGLAIAGLDAYGWWLDALWGAGQVTRRGNLALTALPAAAWAIGAAATVVAMVWAILRDEDAGLIAALLAGLLLAPYTLLYALTVLLVGVRPALAVARRSTPLLALAANVVLVPLPMLWLGACLAATVAAAGGHPRHRWDTGSEAG